MRFLLLPLMDEWLSARHLALFVVEVIGRLDLSAMVSTYCAQWRITPSMLLVYGYFAAVFLNRKLECATYDSVAFRFISASDHSDDDTIETVKVCYFRNRVSGCSDDICLNRIDHL